MFYRSVLFIMIFYLNFMYVHYKVCCDVSSGSAIKYCITLSYIFMSKQDLKFPSQEVSQHYYYYFHLAHSYYYIRRENKYWVVLWTLLANKGYCKLLSSKIKSYSCSWELKQFCGQFRQNVLKFLGYILQIFWVNRSWR